MKQGMIEVKGARVTPVTCHVAVVTNDELGSRVRGRNKWCREQVA
jgi:hypothetical protein